MLLFLLTAFFPSEVTAQQSNNTHIKAFWVIRDRLVSKKSVTEIVETAHKFPARSAFRRDGQRRRTNDESRG